MDLTANIKAIRNRKGLSQAEVARRLGIDQTSYFRFEKRGNKLTLELLERIAQAIGVTLKELLGYSDPAPIISEQELEKLRWDALRDNELIYYQRAEIEELKETLSELLIRTGNG
ncbi:DNA-binding XRE family transcriptional regulator [Spirosoma oryzae]|uniref:DNA-binding XRE family transcriptional regulator n=1 Tax=Spirosoma oryzae TaxID=1469603 RepID=A0A2T0TNE0_9BACT|nr:helix-turn-helix transcriptional regulator [Spirosoma oryzae]PRY47141.1 DNA-binding XRE family transcriptional regulator [Spirosoma oryzae]